MKWMVDWLVGDRPSNSAISKSFTRKKIERKKCKRGGGGVVVAKKAQNMHYILFVGNILGNIIFRKVFFYVRYCFCSRIMAGAFFFCCCWIDLAFFVGVYRSMKKQKKKNGYRFRYRILFGNFSETFFSPWKFTEFNLIFFLSFFSRKN